MAPTVTGRVGGMHTSTARMTIHIVANPLQMYPKTPRFKYRGGRRFLRPKKSRMACGAAYEIFRNKTADVIMELNAVVEAR